MVSRRESGSVFTPLLQPGYAVAVFLVGSGIGQLEENRALDRTSMRRNCRRFYPFFSTPVQLATETAPHCYQTLHQCVRPSERLGIDRCK